VKSKAPSVKACETLEALPALLALARQVVITSFEAGDAESDELRNLLEACVVGALRLRLRERLRAQHVWRPS
jgi:hypothetical protein